MVKGEFPPRIRALRCVILAACAVALATLAIFRDEDVIARNRVLARRMAQALVPLAGHPNFEPMLAALRDLFDLHAVDGRVAFEHDTRAFVGRLA